MELRQLKYFVAVAEQLSFSRAAEALFVTQPLLSQQVADLERTFDRKLFNRNSRSISLTPAGVVLLSEAKSVLHMVDSIYQNVRSAGQDDLSNSTLIFGYDEMFPGSRLTGIITKVRKEAPGIKLEIHSCKHSYLFKALENHEIDVAISFRESLLGAGSYGSQDITFWTAGQERMVLVCPPTAAEETAVLKDILLDKSVFILPHDPRGIQLLLDTYSSCKIPLPPLQTQEHVQDMLMNICAGIGVSVLPYSLCEEFGTEHLTIVSLDDRPGSLLDVRLYALRNNNNSANIYTLVSLLLSDSEQAAASHGAPATKDME